MPPGITPAGAGKTKKLYFSSVLTEDHPRRCGENPNTTDRDWAELGSPPQVRGKPSTPRTASICSGITPAGAGKTAPPQRARRNAWDHPRRCGENFAGFRL